MKVLSTDLGLVNFNDVWNIQKRLHTYKQDNRTAPDIIICTEHYPVYTLGKTGERDHLLVDNKQLKEGNIDYYEIDRGGDITYHGPGQLVVYPIFDLNNYYLDTHRFLRDLEESVILTLSEYSIEAYKDEEFTGVWVANEKICAIGIKVSRWITMHGLAFNVNNDLKYFDRIIPCGIFHKGVTSMKKILGSEPDMAEVKRLLTGNLAKVFGFEIETVDKAKIFDIVSKNEIPEVS